MKKIVFATLMALLLMGSSYGQNYQNLYDQNCLPTIVNSTESEDKYDHIWGGAAKVELLIVMYEKTSDVKYLNKAIECFGNLIDRRDDYRLALGYTDNKDCKGNTGPHWTVEGSHYRFKEQGFIRWVTWDANILYPMVRFAALVKSCESYICHSTYNGSGRYHGQQYTVIADDVVAKAEQTMNAYDDIYVQSVGFYKIEYPLSFFNGSYTFYHELNGAGGFGRVFIQLYNATGNYKYKQRATEIANFVKSKLTTKSYYGGTWFEWFYWDYNDNILPYDYRDAGEDIAHAGYLAMFAKECYLNNIVFNLQDMKSFANTFITRFQKSTYQVYYRMQHDSNMYFDCSNGSYHQNSAPNTGYVMERWLHFIEYHGGLSASLNYKMNGSGYINRWGQISNNAFALSILTKYD